MHTPNLPTCIYTGTLHRTLHTHAYTHAPYPTQLARTLPYPTLHCISRLLVNPMHQMVLSAAASHMHDSAPIRRTSVRLRVSASANSSDHTPAQHVHVVRPQTNHHFWVRRLLQQVLLLVLPLLLLLLATTATSTSATTTTTYTATTAITNALL